MLVLGLVVASCNGPPAPPPVKYPPRDDGACLSDMRRSGIDLAPAHAAVEHTFDVAFPTNVSVPYRVLPGEHALKIRATCSTCTSWQLSAWLKFEGAAHPPVTLLLAQQGKVVHGHRDTSRCFEDEIAPPRADTCTIYVACGVPRGRRGRERELDLVITNGGDERPALMTIRVDDNPPR
jgi:hypothetical protein